VTESNNGESLSLPVHRKPKRHTAKHCPFAIRQRIVSALANGDSKRAIARALRVSNNTVTAIAEQEWQRVAARKQRLAAQWEQAATKAIDQLNDHLDSSRLPPNTLVPIAGVATDKLLALSGDPALTHTQQNLHLYLQSNNVTETFNNLLDRLEEKARALQAIRNVSGDGNLSGDGPFPALTEERTDTEQRDSRRA
jgi:DNA-binding transcriptional MocR family regulator